MCRPILKVVCMSSEYWHCKWKMWVCVAAAAVVVVVTMDQGLNPIQT